MQLGCSLRQKHECPKHSGIGPLFQRLVSVAGGITAAAPSTSRECAEGSDHKEFVTVDLGGEDAAKMISFNFNEHL